MRSDRLLFIFAVVTAAAGTVLVHGLPALLARDWLMKLPFGGQPLSIIGGAGYVRKGTSACQIDLTTGNSTWCTEDDAAYFFDHGSSFAAIVEDLAVVETVDLNHNTSDYPVLYLSLTAKRTSDGQQLWTLPLVDQSNSETDNMDTSLSRPAVQGGLILIAGANGTVSAYATLNATDPTLPPKKLPGSYVYGAKTVAQPPVFGSIDVFGSGVAFLFEASEFIGCTIVALNVSLAAGVEEAWRLELPEMNSCESFSLSPEGPYVFFTGFNNTGLNDIFSYDLVKRKKRWGQNVPGNPAGLVYIGNDTVVVEQGDLSALNATTGNFLWSTNIPRSESTTCSASPTVFPGSVFCSASGVQLVQVSIPDGGNIVWSSNYIGGSGVCDLTVPPVFSAYPSPAVYGALCQPFVDSNAEVWGRWSPVSN